MLKPLHNQSNWLNSYRPGLRLSEQGKVISVGDGIAWIEGLPSAAMDEMLLFADGSRGIVFDLQPEHVGITLLSQSTALISGTQVFGSRELLSIPVGDDLLGRVVDPIGVPLDGLPKPNCQLHRRLDTSSPPIIKRDFVERPLYSGNKIIDTMLPMGRGQRQLIIGDAGLGKSALALDIIVNQKEQDVRCVYVLIGQKRSSVVNTIDTLREHGALEYTTVVVGEANSLPGLKYLAPYSGCTIAERWMEQGHDTLIIYDDLSTHARTYRELSLLLRRPPGREAYPGDIFYLHSRLLERSTALAVNQGGGSMTALPLIQTQRGEIATYIPTNLISITDGQIYLDQHLFSAGMRPAIDVGKSVSRIGGRAQHDAIRAEAGRMKLDYQQFLELEIFTRFGARLESFMERAIQRGRILREILKQERFTPLTIEQQLGWLIAYNEGLFDHCEIDSVSTQFHRLCQTVADTSLDLDSRREGWVILVRETLGDLQEQRHDLPA